MVIVIYCFYCLARTTDATNRISQLSLISSYPYNKKPEGMTKADIVISDHEVR